MTDRIFGRVPQVIITLSPEGGLCAELPGPNGARRRVDLKDGHIEETLLRILHAQLASRVAIGEDGAPTAQQVKHWTQHDMFPDDRCPFCRAEGRCEGGSRRRTLPPVLSEHGGVTVRRVPARQRGAQAKKLVSAKRAEDLGL